jgi:hypothetical protein
MSVIYVLRWQELPAEIWLLTAKSVRVLVEISQSDENTFVVSKGFSKSHVHYWAFISYSLTEAPLVALAHTSRNFLTTAIRKKPCAR